MSIKRRSLLVLLVLLTSQVRAAEGVLVVSLIGTGGPELTPERSGISTLIRVNDDRLLFDAGRNTVDQLYKARVAPQQITKIFLTHLHSDHIEGLPGLWITPWFLLGRAASLRIWGPPGTKQMIDGMRQMYAHDIEQRSTQTLRREYLDLDVDEIVSGVVYSEKGLRVTAISVEHHDGNPAFAYRVEVAGHAVLMTGDATLTPPLEAAGKGVDVLISNVAAGAPAIEKSGAIDPILAKLMRPEQAAQLFVAAKPRLAVFSHVVKKGLPGAAGDSVILHRTREAGYKGPLRMGLDGMTITVGDSIHVQLSQPRKTLPDFDGPGSRY